MDLILSKPKYGWATFCNYDIKNKKEVEEKRKNY